MEHLFLVNPCAGRADSTSRITEQAQALCRRLGEPCSIQVSTHAGELRELARAAGETGREMKLYACGGDGTLNEVASGAADFENLSITSVPCGSGNDFIKHFPQAGAFFDLQNFMQTETRRIDLISVGDSYAVNICSVGFDARIGTSIDAFRRHPLLSGPRAYHASVAVNLFKGVSKPCRVELEDGTVEEGDMTLVCVCNGSWYGGSYHPVPEADLFDGLLDVLVVKKVSRLTVARVIGAYQKGRYAEYPQLISRYQTRSLRIATPEPEPMNLDGELLRTRDSVIRVLPEKLRFFAPAAAWKT